MAALATKPHNPDVSLTRHSKPRRLLAALACWLAYIVYVLFGGGPAAAAEETTRIVSLVPNLTELAFHIDAGNQVVGVSDFCEFPPEAKTRPSVGGLVNPSLEGVLALRPTVVLLYRSQQDFANKLAQLGIRAELFQVDTLSDLYAAIDRLGTETGKTTAATELVAEIRGDLESVRRAAAGRPPVPGIIVVSRDPAGLRSIYQAGQANFLGELFEIAGGKVAVPGSAAISTEDIIRADPALIIDFSSSEFTAPNGKTVSLTSAPFREPGPWEQLSTVSAVRNDDVYLWSNPHALLLGPSVGNTADRFQSMLKRAHTEAQPTLVPSP